MKYLYKFTLKYDFLSKHNKGKIKMKHSDKEKEMREAYERYINQIAYNYMDLV